jgi:hypothetical protein
MRAKEQIHRFGYRFKEVCFKVLTQKIVGPADRVEADGSGCCSHKSKIHREI